MPSSPDTIVLIHGFWVTPRSWEHWIEHYEAKGYAVVAPEDLRRVIVEGCAGPQARAVARQLGLELGEDEHRRR